MTSWAIDLGTTNTGVAVWDERAGQPRLVELPGICRAPERDDPLEAPRLVPSAVHMLEEPAFLDRLGAWPPLRRRYFLGRSAWIGRQALELNQGEVHAAFVPTFKHALTEEVLRPVARVGRHACVPRRRPTLAMSLPSTPATRYSPSSRHVTEGDHAPGSATTRARRHTPPGTVRPAAQAPAACSWTRTRTMRVTRSVGMGRSAANRSVPLPATWGATSSPSVSMTTWLAGNRL